MFPLRFMDDSTQQTLRVLTTNNSNHAVLDVSPAVTVTIEAMRMMSDPQRGREDDEAHTREAVGPFDALSEEHLRRSPETTPSSRI